LSKNYNKDIIKIVVSILEGSHNWAINEDRYKAGLIILKKVLSEDTVTFNSLILDK